MRKVCSVLIGIFFTLAFTTCKQFTENIEDYLSYWAAEVFALNYNIDKPQQTNKDGILCVASAEDVTVTVKLNNPKNFRLVTPKSSADAGKIIRFPNLSAQPEYGADYTLVQPAHDTLTLTYKKAFLQAHEWGNGGISPEITLTADDGRVFKQTFTVSLKANTPPPKPGFIVAKTAGSPAYYVLCLTAPDMDKKIARGLLHKDLARIEVNGTGYSFSVNEAQKAFTKPESGSFITHSDVTKLSEPDADEVPTGGWVLYYKTDVEVKEGAAKKDYTVRLADAQGLVSELLNASTKPNKAENETIRITKGTKISGSGSEADPIIIGTGSAGAELTASSPTENTTVHCTVSEIGGAAPAKYDGNPVTVPLPLNGAGEKKYKLEYYTDGAGFAATPVRTVYYKVVPGHTVIFDANGGAYPDSSTAVSKVALHGATVTAPDTLPVKQGFGLTGWYKDKDCSAGQEWNFAADRVTSDIKLYAKWIPNTQPTVTFSVTGGNGGKIKAASGSAVSSGSVQVEYGESVTFTAQPDEGYEVDSWSNNVTVDTSDKKQATLSNVTEDTTVTVKFKKKVYTLTFSVDGEGGELRGTYNSQTKIAKDGNTETFTDVPHGTEVEFTAPSKLAWEIEGWTLDGTAVNGISENYTSPGITGDITVMVKFKKVTTVKGSDNNAWALLKEVVKIADNNAVITIEGKITASSGDNAGEITMGSGNNLTIKGKTGAGSDKLNANSMSRIFKVESNKTLTLENLTLTGGKAEGTGLAGSGGGILVWNKGTVRMTNCTIKDCKAEVDGGAIHVGRMNSVVRIAGGEISGNTATEGGGISIDQTCKLYININDAGTPDSGSTQTVITNNHIDGTETKKYISGGAIICRTNAELKLHNTKISQCGPKVTIAGANAYGAGLRTSEEVTATLTSVEISDCKFEQAGVGTYDQKLGGAIYIGYSTAKTVTLGDENNNSLSCNIHDNGDNQTKGGGIINYGILTIHGGSITGNKAQIGGGIINNKTLTIHGCSIADNQAQTGGGVCTFGGKITMESGAIQSNTASKNGGGVAVLLSSSEFTMKGSAQVHTNNDVYLNDDAKITVDNGLTGTAPVARITVPDAKYQTGTQVLIGGAVNTEHGKFTVTRGGSPVKDWYVDKNGKLTDSITDIFNNITQDAIKAVESSMNYTSSYGTDASNLKGKLLLYKTSEGNYGIMHVTDVNTSGFKFNYKTFKSGGAVQSGNDITLSKTWVFNLDDGTNDGAYDFQFTEQGHFQPQESAKFYVMGN